MEGTARNSFTSPWDISENRCGEIGGSGIATGKRICIPEPPAPGAGERRLCEREQTCLRSKVSALDTGELNEERSGSAGAAGRDVAGASSLRTRGEQGRDAVARE